MLYSGNSDTQAITGLGFEPSIVWLKRRDGTDQHILFDAPRGTTQFLEITDGAADTSSATIAYDSDGFTLSSYAGMNQSGETYVGWGWKGSGVGSANTDGTIASTVSVNTAAGFSVVKYTGTNSNDQTVGHGLSQAPELIIFKRYGGTNGWRGGSSVAYMDITLSNDLGIGGPICCILEKKSFGFSDIIFNLFLVCSDFFCG